MYHYQFYFPFLLTLESLFKRSRRPRIGTGSKSLLNVKFTPCVSCTVHIFCNNDVDRDSDSFRYVIQSCYDLLMSFYGPLAPQMNSFNNIVTGVFSWYTKVTENLAYNNIKMGTCHVPPPGIKWINQSREYTYYQKLLFYIKPQSEENQQKVQNL